MIEDQGQVNKKTRGETQLTIRGLREKMSELEGKVSDLKEEMSEVKEVVTALQEMVMELSNKADVFGGSESYWTVRDTSI